MARLFADENFPFPTVQALRRLGHDVVTVEDVGRGGQRWSDADVLEFARSNGRVLVTLNRKDFLRLYSAVQPRGPTETCVGVNSVGALIDPGSGNCFRSPLGSTL